ncbi:UvrD-helicase domain-containing protein [Vibrio lentus]|uniref:DNA 3'-5' helicase II n=1 Tax=Vibrio lentus TaxID=136468 RepID=A0AB36XU84_9VIBR|nr:UvrD-helicase domain-containing protein [Vibrio lentus]MCC4836781.1 UvrD-helicase domain-containing protein [Vibrio lentus]PMI16395.1 DNA helicase UvrD [Vibrio lentus]PMK35399.1 DNA helicase UvrD [Vibrio lentus]PMK49935.1 DNA helicase UvrD [Vibrio lentus]PML31628.1 DNA helicase UvrD [Vibrio lentus]
MEVEFTNEQLDYVNSNIEEHIFLEACPGSGKTEVVATKVAKEIDSWKKRPGGFAALSFANSATDELTSRVSKHLPNGREMFPHFLGTFDSFIYKNIVSPLSTELTGYAGEGGDASIHIIEPTAHMGYRTKYSYAKRGQVKAHHYSFDLVKGSVVFDTGDSILNRTLSSIALQDWQLDDLIATKNKILKGGFATYRDIEYLALKAITEKKYENFFCLLVKRYPLIIIDECQDLSEEQLAILQVFANKGTKLHFVGDLHQAIYGFRDVEPAKVKQFVEDNNFTTLQLTRNFRSCQNIVSLCANLTGRTGIVGNVSWLEPRCIVFQYNNCPTELIDTLKRKCDGFSNSVVVSRGHSILRRFQTSVTEPNNIQKLALAVKFFSPKDMEELSQSLQYFSEFLRYHLKESYKPNSFNCPQSITSNLAWRKFLYESLNYLICNNLQKIDIKWSDWTKTAKVLMRELPKQSFCPEDISSVLAPLEVVNLTSPSGLAKLEVALSLGTTTASLLPYKKSTIHGAKGETHDVTIVISSASAGNDSHWQSWLKTPDSEAARFAYVAASRPKELLIWAVKTLKPPERKQLEAVGFTII